MYLMFIIFLIEITFSIAPLFVGQITSLIARLMVKVSDEELNMREEIKDLKSEQVGLSVTDEFVQYARIQRKVDKLMAQIKAKGGERKQRISYLKFGVTVGIYIVHGVLMFILMLTMRNQPLMSLPSEWMVPFSKLVAFPTGIPGAIGFGFWVLVCNTVIRRVRGVMSQTSIKPRFQSVREVQQLPLD